MKKILFALSLVASSMTMNAEIVDTYNAPTNFQAYHVEDGALFWFNAPAEGGVVWASAFSYDNGLSGMLQIGDGDTWANAGGGTEISTSAAFGLPFTNHAGTLATPAMKLEKGTNYEVSFKSAGSRSTGNQQLSLVLYQGENAVKTIMEAYELSPSLTYEEKSATFTVDATADDYVVRFVFGASEKNSGASLMNIVFTAPVPEGRGELMGYNVYRNDEFERFFPAEEAVQNNLYKQLTDDTALEEGVTYTYALQAVYEGGESPLSNTASFTTPMAVGINNAATYSVEKHAYDLMGRRIDKANGIVVVDGRKVKK